MSSAHVPVERGASRPEDAAARVGGLFVRHGRMVYGVCRAMLRDLDEAEDAAQQVFLSAHTALLGGAEVRDPARWLATIARNECRGRIAVGMRRPFQVSDEDLELLPAARDERAERELLSELRAALAALPDRQREAVVLRYVYGLRYREVSAALGLSRAATEALLFRARRGLRRRLATLAGAVLVVPASLREELALALPGFSTGTTGTSVAAVGAAGGVLAKLATAPGGVKVAATAAAAVSTVGTVGTIQSDGPTRANAGPVASVERVGPVQPPAPMRRRDTARPPSGPRDETDRSGPGGGREGEGRSGHDETWAVARLEAELDDSSGPGSDTDVAHGIASIEASPSSGSAGSSGSADSSGPSEPSGSGSSDGGSGSDDSSGSSSGGGSDHGSRSGQGEP